jgi:predicted DNA repair protein MutK
MKFLGLAGTVAMFLVGGGIITHSFEFLHHYGQTLHPLLQSVFDGVIGMTAGAITLVVVMGVSALKKKL